MHAPQSKVQQSFAGLAQALTGKEASGAGQGEVEPLGVVLAAMISVAESRACGAIGRMPRARRQRLSTITKLTLERYAPMSRLQRGLTGLNGDNGVGPSRHRCGPLAGGDRPGHQELRGTETAHPRQAGR